MNRRRAAGLRALKRDAGQSGADALAALERATDTTDQDAPADERSDR